MVFFRQRHMTYPLQHYRDIELMSLRKGHKLNLLWVQADDFPISGQIATLSGADLDAKRQQWLRRHDQDTGGGSMGFFPLIPDLPVLFTTTLDKTRKIFKFMRGSIRAWTLDPVDEERVKASNEQDIILQKPPLMVYVEKVGENMPQHLDLDPQIYGVTCTLCPSLHC